LCPVILIQSSRNHWNFGRCIAARQCSYSVINEDRLAIYKVKSTGQNVAAGQIVATVEQTIVDARNLHEIQHHGAKEQRLAEQNSNNNTKHNINYKNSI
jgi:hypothetical protein